jgi:hypothetical protein
MSQYQKVLSPFGGRQTPPHELENMTAWQRWVGRNTNCQVRYFIANLDTDCNGSKQVIHWFDWDTNTTVPQGLERPPSMITRL